MNWWLLKLYEGLLKILQARLQQYVNCELPNVQVGFWKGIGISNQIANIRWIIEKAREFQKSIYLCFIDYTKAFDCVPWNDGTRCHDLMLDQRKSKKTPEKHLLLLHWPCLWLCGSQQTMENSKWDGNTRQPYLSPEKPVYRSRSWSWSSNPLATWYEESTH